MAFNDRVLTLTLPLNQTLDDTSPQSNTRPHSNTRQHSNTRPFPAGPHARGTDTSVKTVSLLMLAAQAGMQQASMAAW